MRLCSDIRRVFKIIGVLPRARAIEAASSDKEENYIYLPSRARVALY